jgi:hypothetical protein
MASSEFQSVALVSWVSGTGYKLLHTLHSITWIPHSICNGDSSSAPQQARPLLTRAVEEDNYDDLIDPRLETDYDAHDMARLVACAAAAVRQTARCRPRMSQVRLPAPRTERLTLDAASLISRSKWLDRPVPGGRAVGGGPQRRRGAGAERGAAVGRRHHGPDQPARAREGAP